MDWCTNKSCALYVYTVATYFHEDIHAVGKKHVALQLDDSDRRRFCL